MNRELTSEEIAGLQDFLSYYRQEQGLEDPTPGAGLTFARMVKKMAQEQREKGK